jgi:uncharacterized membrane protein
MTRPLVSEQTIHRIFDISLWVKALFALVEIAGGIAAFFVSHALLIHLAAFVTQGELAEDPHDIVATTLLQTVQHIAPGTQHFAALYLLGHGVVKLWLISGLLREKLWYYPLALAVFAGFVGYQLYRYAATHSVWLIVITAVDLVVIALTWHEYRYLRRRVAAAPSPS